MELQTLVTQAEQAEISEDGNSESIRELANLDLALIGGGSGDVVVC